MSISDVVFMCWVALMAKSTASIRFDVGSGTSKCISEDIKIHTIVYGKYAVVNPNSDASPIPDTYKLTVKMTSPSGKSYHLKDGAESGSFAFTAAETGDHAVCFFPRAHKPAVMVTVEFDLRTGVAAADWSNIAKKGHVKVMEVELKKLYATVSSIHDEMFYLREREEEMQQFNRTTNLKMACFSLFSLLVCVSVAGLQIWHLKSFFERKKLL